MADAPLTLPAGPMTVQLVAMVRGDAARLLPGTLAALAVPQAAGWHLTVLADSRVPADFVPGGATDWQYCPSGELLAEANRLIAAGQAGWVGMIEAGDVLATEAYVRLAAEAGRHPGWLAFYSDEAALDETGRPGAPFFKTDFNIDLLRSASFAVGGLLLVRRSAFLACGGFDPAAEGVELFDLCLRLYEAGGGAAIGHVAEVLYLRHPEGGHSLRGTDEMVAARNRSLLDHLHRCGLEASLDEGYLQGTYRLRYRHAGHPLVSIIVPTKNQRAFLARCLSTLVAKTAYPNFEVLVVDNGSTEPDALAYLAGLPQADARIRVLASPGPFNFAAMNNQAAREARGEYLLLLNNDTAVLHEDWLDEMMAHARRPEVGVVGARLIYPTGKIQHAGVVLGLNNSPADHPYLGSELADVGYYGRLQLVQDLSAVTGACLLVARPLYEQVGGLDEAAFQVSFNDIDLCLKIGELGRLIVWTPFATLLHEGSASQASETERATLTDRQRRFLAERQHIYAKWRRQIAFDPAYNRNLSLRGRYPEAEPEAMLRLAPDDRPRPRILAHPGDRAGSGEYRVLAPMRALNGAGRVDGLESSRYLGVPELIRFEPDSIVLQRQIENRNIELIEGYARNSRAFKVFELDDLLFNPPVRHVASAQVANLPELKKRLRKAIGLCDRLVVSTDYLAEAMREYATDIVVCPNYIEAARWQGLKALRRAAAKPRIGWAGSLGHEGDLALIVDVVKATLAEADWVFLGYCPESLKAAVEFHPLVTLDDYPAKLASLNLDLAVAPLEDLPFNHAKSHLRLLEYGALGCPVVCSDVTPYRGEFPVRRVRNRHREWLEAIRAYLAEPDELQRAGATLRQFVTERWTLETHLESWLKAWMP